jgi:DNA (cytosine-5)-methyltransferase 1
MRFGSVCSGIEAASVAWHPLGWKAAWLSEIEPFPSAVLAHHYPDVPNLGDMTALPDRIRSGEVEAPDLFCGGTPCQAFSVAGLRKSLDDDRGNLSLTFCEIADAIDDVRRPAGQQPAIIFWENVPGVLNTKDNAFGCFLAGLAGESLPLLPAGGRWTNAGCVLGPQRAIAWRVLDAQYFGVAQRRRRVFVVASARDGFNPAEILFEFGGLRRDTAPSREAGKGATAGAKGGIGESGAGVTLVGLQDCNTLSAEVAGTIVTREGVVADTAHMVMQPVSCLHEAPIPAYALQGAGHTSQNSQGSGWNEEISFTLNCMDVHGVAQPIGIFQDSEFGVQKYESAGTLRAGRIPEHQMVMQPMAFTTEQTPKFNRDQALTLTKQSPTGGGQPQCVMAPTLTASNDPSRSPQSSEVTNQVAAVHAVSMAVRRLTPVECERLQGFPDNYTNIPWRKQAESPDGPRYKALGNSWAVPVVRWIGSRIQESLK